MTRSVEPATRARASNARIPSHPKRTARTADLYTQGRPCCFALSGDEAEYGCPNFAAKGSVMCRSHMRVCERWSKRPQWRRLRRRALLTRCLSFFEYLPEKRSH